MRILYGITGEGLGHTMRARVLIEHLRARGHSVKIAASGRALEILGDRQQVLPIDGLSLAYAHGALQRTRTVARNARRAPQAIARNFTAALEAIRFDPQLVITDFDSFAYTLGRLLEVPIVSIDHQHVLSRFVHPASVRRRLSYDFALVRGVVRRKLPRCHRYIVTSFFYPPPRDECADTTHLVGPILRAEVDRLAPTQGDHVFVYQTGNGDPRLLAMLHALPAHRFVVYGAAAARGPAHVEYRPFSEAGFLHALASAKVVIANGGYTTLSEAVCLGKPVLSVPIRHQGEQELNAAYLEEDGLGRCLRSPSLRSLREGIDTLAARSPGSRRGSASRQAARALDDALEALA
jgi:uncharacterized protein (TIGR00661 family)